MHLDNNPIYCLIIAAALNSYYLYYCRTKDNRISLLYFLLRSHSVTHCLLMLSCRLYHMLLVSVSSYTHYTVRHTTLVIISHYTNFTLTLQLLYSHTQPLSLSSCTLNSIQLYNSHSSCRGAFELWKLFEISDVRFRTCIILINSQEVIEDFRKRDFMVYRHGD